MGEPERSVEQAPSSRTGRIPIYVIMIIFLAFLAIFFYYVWEVVTPLLVWLILVLILFPFAYDDPRAVALILLVTLAGLLYGVISLWDAFLPFVVALVLAFFLDPLCDRFDIWFNRWFGKRERSEPPEDKLGRRLRSFAALTVIILVLGVLVGLGFALAPTIERDLDRLSDFDFKGIIAELDGWIDKLAGDNEQLRTTLQRGTADLEQTIAEALPSATQVMETVFAQLGNLGNLILIPIFTFLLLRDVDRFKQKLATLVPVKLKSRFNSLSEDANRVFIGFFRTKSIGCLFVACWVGVGLYLIGVPFYLPIAIITGILNFIPFLGPFLGAVLATPIALLTPDPILSALLTIGLYVSANAIDGYILDPLIVGRKVGIGPVLLLLSVLVGFQFGLLWAFLAVPLAALLKVVILQLERFYRRSPIYCGAQGDAPSTPPADCDTDAS
ncbi:MAG: AI-2E family transporter [Candidatus Coatesbacteria bacterium]|nr:AI-2E family transporter [Candidatus Coatesbacteria bacterium]